MGRSVNCIARLINLLLSRSNTQLPSTQQIIFNRLTELLNIRHELIHINNQINIQMDTTNLRQPTRLPEPDLYRAPSPRQPSLNAFFQALQHSMEENYRQVQVTTPSDGENAKRAELLPEDVVIPDEFICPLSRLL